MIRTRPRSVTVLAAGAALALLGSIIQRPAVAQVLCDPIQTSPVFDPDVPTGEDVFVPPFAIGSQEVTSDQANDYIQAVDAASDRVTSGTAATSVLGKDVNFAIVGAEENVTPAGLFEIREAIGELRDPATTAEEAELLADDTPAILWVDGSPHGGEESGGDTSLRILYELAARTDCAAERILDEAIVVVVPVYNPDGQDLDQRRNANGFDMNRDWFARTSRRSTASSS
jgi:Zinc carboxypeptidase